MILVTLLLARLLGVEDFGRLTLAQGLVTSLQVFILLGAGPFLSRYLPQLRLQGMGRAVELVNLYGVVVVTTAAILSILVLLTSDMIVETVLDIERAAAYSGWIVAWTVFAAFNGLLLAVILAFEQGRLLGVIALLSAILWLIVPPLLTLELGFEGAVVGLVLVEGTRLCALTAAYIWFLRRSGARPFAKPKRSDVPILFSFGLPVFLQSAVWAPTIWLAQVTVKTLSPDGLAAVGIFGLGNAMLGAVILLGGLTNRAAMPVISSLQAGGDPAQARRASWMLALLQIGVAILLSLPLMIAAPFIAAQLGPSFAAAWPVLIIMIATGIVIAGQTSLANYLLIVDRPWFLLATIVPWALILLGTTAMFSPHGAYALAGGLLLASIVRTLLILMGWGGHGTEGLRSEDSNVVS